MKQYRIARVEIEHFIEDSFDPEHTSLRYLVVERLVRNGFDRDKPIREYLSTDSEHLIYEQED